MKRRILIIFLIFGMFLMSFGKEISIGVIYGDQSKEVNENLRLTLERELKKNFENTQYHPKIKKEVVSPLKDLGGAVEKLQADKGIEVIFSMDINPTKYLNGKYTKLVLAPFAYDSIVEVKNLNAISTNYSLKEIINILGETRDIKKIGIVYSGEFKITADQYRKKLVSEKMFSDKDVAMISLEDSKEKIETDISKNDGLIVLSDKDLLLQGPMEKSSEIGVPSFSLFFNEKNDAGVLMGYSLEEEQDRRIRVAALNLLKYYEGRNFSELTKNLDSENSNILVDYRVAKASDLYPGDLLSEKIKMINESELGTVKLSLKDAIKQLLKNNTELQSEKEDLVSSEYDVKIAKSALKPTLTATLDYDKQDNTRARLYSTGAENSLQGGAKISQVLYDESTFSNITIQKRLYDATKENIRSGEIEKIQNLLESYITVLKDNSRLEIEKNNLNLVKKYLSVARTKYSIGSGGPEDVYRFESELADSMTNLEDIRSSVLAGNSDLNRLLNLSMDTYFSLGEEGIEDIIDLYLFYNFENELNKPWKFDKVKNYFIEQALENSSELKSIDARIAAKERELKTAKRKRYLPTITASGNYDRDLVDPWGTGSSNTEADEYWNAGVGFSIPLYNGGELSYTKKQVESQLEKLKFDRESKISQISNNISSQYAKVFANYRRIKSAEKSAEASRKSLDLQTELYIKGKINITDMIDARNSFIQADQKNISVKFDFFISQSKLEKLCGKYYFEYNDIEKGIVRESIKNLITSK